MSRTVIIATWFGSTAITALLAYQNTLTVTMFVAYMWFPAIMQGCGRYIEANSSNHTDKKND